MSQNRFVFIGLTAAIIVVALFGWFIGIQPVLASTAASNAQRASLVLENQQHAADLAALKKQYEGIDDMRASLAELQGEVPADSDLSTFLGELTQLAAAAAAGIASVTPGDAQLYTAPAAAVPAATDATDATDSTTATTAATTAAADGTVVPIAVNDAAAAAAQEAGFIAIPVQIGLTAGYPQLMQFVAGLQSGQRLFLVTSIALGTGASDASTVGGIVFVLPNSAVAATAGK
jgi:Tfp pilus assembly protein PilO